jgi:hypothetical protein
MKYMNHLRKLALLSSLALSFGVQADGTLPLPIQDTTKELPLNMQDPSVDLTVRIDNMNFNPGAQPMVGGVQPCGRTEEYYGASGYVFHEGNTRNVIGICKPRMDSLNRTVVAINSDSVSDASALVLLQGNLDAKTSFKHFKGKLSNKVLAAPGSVAGPSLGEAETAAPVDFVLSRTR